MNTLTAPPYQNDSLNKIYQLLFCDDLTLFPADTKESTVYPWNIIFAPVPKVEQLRQLIADPTTETRVKLLAYHILASTQQPITSKDLLGIVIEVGMEEGLDVLAAYEDGSARYINHSEKIIFLEAPTDKSTKLITDLFTEGRQVVKMIGPWDQKRPEPPLPGDIRLNFLVADGLYFGQGPFEMLAKDPMGAPVIKCATDLMIFLTEQQ